MADRPIDAADGGCMVRPMRLFALVVVATLVTLAAVAPAANAQESETPRWWHVYLQQSFPKQTATNAQIDLVNETFGASFDTWDDVANLSLGSQLFWQVAPRFKLGIELDVSMGQIDGETTVDTGAAGLANLKFVQKYALYANVFAAAHYLPCPRCERAIPFVLGAVGVGYEKDETALTLHNSFVYQRLLVANDGYFPVFTTGFGVDIPLHRGGDAFVELGTAYYWGRLKHHVPASGALAPAPEVLADTDSTGPNYWVGFARRF